MKRKRNNDIPDVKRKKVSTDDCSSTEDESLEGGGPIWCDDGFAYDEEWADGEDDVESDDEQKQASFATGDKTNTEDVTVRFINSEDGSDDLPSLDDMLECTEEIAQEVDEENKGSGNRLQNLFRIERDRNRQDASSSVQGNQTSFAKSYLFWMPSQK